MTCSVIVVGAGGFGRETLDVLDALARAGSPVSVRGVLDDNPSQDNIRRLEARGIQFMGSIEGWLGGPASHAGFLIGIGDPRVRRRLETRLLDSGNVPFHAIHPSAHIGSSFEVGPGVIVCAGANISTNVRIGSFSHVNPGAIVGHDTTIAEFVSVNPGAIVSGEVSVGARSLIGAGAVVLQGLTVGREVTIGAGSVVTRNVPSGVTVKGVPGVW